MYVYIYIYNAFASVSDELLGQSAVDHFQGMCTHTHMYIYIHIYPYTYIQWIIFKANNLESTLDLETFMYRNVAHST